MNNKYDPSKNYSYVCIYNSVYRILFSKGKQKVVANFYKLQGISIIKEFKGKLIGSQLVLENIFEFYKNMRYFYVTLLQNFKIQINFSF